MDEKPRKKRGPYVLGRSAEEKYLVALERAREYKRRNSEAMQASRSAYYAANKEREAALNKLWVANNPATKPVYDKRYRDKHGHKIKARKSTPEYKAVANAKQRERYATDVNYRLKMIFRASFRQALNAQGASKKEQVLKLLGCSVAEFKAYLEPMFLVGMTWENHGEWHIDHIRPVASFDMTILEDRQACWYYTNFQPLWAKDNLNKRARLDWVPPLSPNHSSTTIP